MPALQSQKCGSWVKAESDDRTDVPAKVDQAKPPLCRSCGTALATDWSHCPRCGMAVVHSDVRKPPVAIGETPPRTDRDPPVGPENGAARDR